MLYFFLVVFKQLGFYSINTGLLTYLFLLGILPKLNMTSEVDCTNKRMNGDRLYFFMVSSWVLDVCMYSDGF